MTEPALRPGGGTWKWGGGWATSLLLTEAGESVRPPRRFRRMFRVHVRKKDRANLSGRAGSSCAGKVADNISVIAAKTRAGTAVRGAHITLRPNNNSLLPNINSLRPNNDSLRPSYGLFLRNSNSFLPRNEMRTPADATFFLHDPAAVRRRDYPPPLPTISA